MTSLILSLWLFSSAFAEPGNGGSQEARTLAAAAAAEFNGMVRFPVQKWTLPNGLTVLFHEEHAAPLVSVHQWFRVGSRNEKPGRTGLAHFFEHLMFKGTKKYPDGTLDRMIKSNGGTNNAFTTQDYTGYYATIPSGALEIILDLESNRMVQLMFNPVTIKSEREVVKEERRMRVENSISGMINEALFTNIFSANNYRWPVIGYMDDLNAATVDDLQDFYRIHYAPNNAVLVIVGDVSLPKVKDLVNKYYSGIKSQPVQEVQVAAEPVQDKEKKVVIQKDVQATTVAVAFQAPKAGEDQAYALDLLSSILGGGPSSRLYKKLVYQDQVASTTSSWNYTLKDASIFAVTASLRPGQNVDKVLQSIYSELEQVRTKLVADIELEKSKNQSMVSFVNSLKSMEGKAQALAVNEILFGSYEELFKDLDKYQKVTKESILEAAKKYLDPKGRTVIKVEPKPKH